VQPWYPPLPPHPSLLLLLPAVLPPPGLTCCSGLLQLLSRDPPQPPRHGQLPHTHMARQQPRHLTLNKTHSSTDV